MRYLVTRDEHAQELKASDDNSAHGRPVLLVSDPATPGMDFDWRFGSSGIMVLGSSEPVRDASIDFVVIQRGSLTLGEVKADESAKPRGVRVYGTVLDAAGAEQTLAERRAAIEGVVRVEIPGDYPSLSTTTVYARIPGEKGYLGTSDYRKSETRSGTEEAPQESRGVKRRRIAKAVRAFLKDAK